MLAVTLSLYALGIRLLFRKKLMAFYYTLAYSPLVFFVIHFILTSAQLTSSKNPLDWEYVIFFEVAVLTIAMGHRYYLINRERNYLQNAVIAEQNKGLKAVFEATEEERKRIAKDLHDGVGQQLSALKRGFEELSSKLEGDVQSETVQLKTLVDEAAAETRSISHQMMPRALTELGLVPAIEDSLNKSLGYTSIKFEFEHYNLKERYDERKEVAIYRIMQELINNVIKHSKATFVSVQLFESKSNLILMVEDDGQGLKQQNREGSGLLNIKNRLSVFEGKVNIGSSGSSGMIATISIPL